MPFKLVTKESISNMTGDSYTYNGMTFIGKSVEETISELRLLGYCASERALVDAGCYPIKAQNSTGKNVYVIKLK